MTKRRKSSKCPEPINTLLDIAGAATLGLYVKHKVKKDFEKGCGEESAKAAAIVFGMGAMRRGSRGMYNLGGLMGLNSALKEIERKQISVRNYDNHSYVSRPVMQALPEIVKPGLMDSGKNIVRTVPPLAFILKILVPRMIMPMHFVRPKN